LLGRGDGAADADLADHPGPDRRAVGALDKVADDDLGHLGDAHVVDPPGQPAILVETRPHHDLDVAASRDVPNDDGIATEADVRHVDDAPDAPPARTLELLAGQHRVDGVDEGALVDRDQVLV